MTPWFFASGGYLFSKVSGDASFQRSTLDFNYAPTTGEQWFGNQILLEQQSHVFSLGALLGPWDGLTLSAGIQNEWTRQQGFGNADLQYGNPTTALLTSDPVNLRANLDRANSKESLSARFTKIPHTVLYAETRFQQESSGRYEEQVGGLSDPEPFVRDTDATSNLQEYRVGFNTSPWQHISFNANGRHTLKESDYAHLRDIPPGGHAYPAFIRWRDITTDQFEAKVVLRPVTWLKTSVAYKLVATDYDTATDPVPGLTPGGGLFAGNYDAHVYSVNTTLTPIRRLYVSSTLSYSDSRTATAQNGAPYIVPYRGDVYTLLSSATFALSETTDLYATYLFSTAGYGQSNPAGLAAGIDYDRHGLQAGVTRRFKNNLTTNLQYGFYQYREPTSGGANNYEAHSIFATLTLQWP